jgi:hypothetical protein
VVDTVVGRCSKGSPNAHRRLEIETAGGGATVSFNIPPIGLGEFGRRSDVNTSEGSTSTTGMVFGGPMKLYADPETEVNATLHRNISSGSSSCVISIAGHLVDL